MLSSEFKLESKKISHQRVRISTLQGIDKCRLTPRENSIPKISTPQLRSSESLFLRGSYFENAPFQGLTSHKALAEIYFTCFPMITNGITNKNTK
jgi:hypothetical protein